MRAAGPARVDVPGGPAEQAHHSLRHAAAVVQVPEDGVARERHGVGQAVAHGGKPRAAALHATVVFHAHGSGGAAGNVSG